MLERDGGLATWALDALPAAWANALAMDAAAPPTEVVAARQLVPHRIAYLDYEGPVSDDRGHVIRSDGGVYDVQEWSPRVVQLELRGKRIVGPVKLERVAADDQSRQWRLAALPPADMASK